MKATGMFTNFSYAGLLTHIHFGTADTNISITGVPPPFPHPLEKRVGISRADHEAQKRVGETNSHLGI